MRSDEVLRPHEGTQKKKIQRARTTDKPADMVGFFIGACDVANSDIDRAKTAHFDNRGCLNPCVLINNPLQVRCNKVWNRFPEFRKATDGTEHPSP